MSFQLHSPTSMLSLSSQTSPHMYSPMTRELSVASRLITMQYLFSMLLIIIMQALLQLKSTTSTNSMQCSLLIKHGTKLMLQQFETAGEKLASCLTWTYHHPSSHLSPFHLSFIQWKPTMIPLHERRPLFKVFWMAWRRLGPSSLRIK